MKTTRAYVFPRRPTLVECEYARKLHEQELKKMKPINCPSCQYPLVRAGVEHDKENKHKVYIIFKCRFCGFTMKKS